MSRTVESSGAARNATVADFRLKNSAKDRSVGQPALLCLGVLLLALSFWGGWRETTPFLIRPRDFDYRVSAINHATNETHPISSWESRLARRVRLEYCLNTLHSALQTSAASAEFIAGIQRGCLRLAESSASRAPMSANDWFIAAALAYNLGDRPAFERYLRMSFLTGPDEQWIAERRALFAYAVRATLPSDLAASTDADLLLLLRTKTGIRQLATQYVQDATLREHLAELAERLPAELQRQFLSLVQEQIQQ